MLGRVRVDGEVVRTGDCEVDRAYIRPTTSTGSDPYTSRVIPAIIKSKLMIVGTYLLELPIQVPFVREGTRHRVYFRIDGRVRAGIGSLQHTHRAIISID